MKQQRRILMLGTFDNPGKHVLRIIWFGGGPWRHMTMDRMISHLYSPYIEIPPDYEIDPKALKDVIIIS